jgi:hypothetical protein
VREQSRRRPPRCSSNFRRAAPATTGVKTGGGGCGWVRSMGSHPCRLEEDDAGAGGTQLVSTSIQELYVCLIFLKGCA